MPKAGIVVSFHTTGYFLPPVVCVLGGTEGTNLAYLDKRQSKPTEYEGWSVLTCIHLSAGLVLALTCGVCL